MCDFPSLPMVFVLVGCFSGINSTADEDELLSPWRMHLPMGCRERADIICKQRQVSNGKCETNKYWKMNNVRHVLLNTALELALAVVLPKSLLILNDSALENHLHSMNYSSATNAECSSPK